MTGARLQNLAQMPLAQDNDVVPVSRVFQIARQRSFDTDAGIRLSRPETRRPLVPLCSALARSTRGGPGPPPGLAPHSPRRSGSLLARRSQSPRRGPSLAPTLSAKASGPAPTMSALRAYMSAAGTRALPAEITEHAKSHLLDTLASMISGSELAPGQAAQRYIRERGAKGAATVAGFALTAAPIDAALANGVLAHSDETDDSHNNSHSHPGCSVVPAALAAGEVFAIVGARF